MGREYVVLLLATLVWGSVHPTVKFALTELTSVELALLRPLCACLILTLLVFSTGRAGLLAVEFTHAPTTLLTLGVLGFSLSGGMTALALGYLPASITSLITNSSPLIVVLGLLLFRQRVEPLSMVGALMGLVGLAVLTLTDVQLVGDLTSTLVGSLFALGSAACWAVYTALARRLAKADPIATTAITSAVGSAAVALIALPTQDWGRLTHASPQVLAATVWSGAVATGCTYAAWSFALRRLPAVAVAPFGYFIPVSAVAISHVWLGEPLTGSVLVGGLLVLTGVALTQATLLTRAMVIVKGPWR